MSMRGLSITVLVTALLGAGCSSDPAPPPETGSGQAPMVTPLIGSAVADPVPVPATDGRVHLAYELVLSNTLPGAVTITSLSARSGDDTLATLRGDNLKFWTRALGASATPTNKVESGQSVVVWMDVALDSGTEPPTELTHTVDLAVSKPVPGLVPATLTQPVAPVAVSDHKPVSVAPPLDGTNWLNGDGCCGMSAHRMALNPINGKLYAAERFAIDYVQLRDDFRMFTGPATANESYPYFGTQIHAVGEGKVVAVRDGLPEQTPTKAPTGIPLDEYGGNHVVQDLGDGNYAYYAHLQPGTITVKPGDELTAGQPFAELGNSGNSDAPHLHFHVMDGPDPLMANGLPFVIKNFTVSQRVASTAGLDALASGRPAPLQPGFAAREESEVSPLDLDVMNYSVGQ